MEHNIFDDRERAFEARFMREQEVQFRIHARRDKLLGHWAAARMGMTDAEADAYAIELLSDDIEHPGDRDIVAKIIHDMARHGIPIQESEIRVELERLEGVARRQLET